MTEHVHECEWKYIATVYGITGARCSVEGCGAELQKSQVTHRINEYETLKKATDALSAGDATTASYLFKDRDSNEHRIQLALRAYADILSGDTNDRD